MTEYNVHQDFVAPFRKRRVLVENCFAKMKIFKCLGGKWRESYEQHQKCFFILANVVNMMNE
jgi:hypothetical protein